MGKGKTVHPQWCCSFWLAGWSQTNCPALQNQQHITLPGGSISEMRQISDEKSEWACLHVCITCMYVCSWAWRYEKMKQQTCFYILVWQACCFPPVQEFPCLSCTMISFMSYIEKNFWNPGVASMTCSTLKMTLSKWHSRAPGFTFLSSRLDFFALQKWRCV